MAPNSNGPESTCTGDRLELTVIVEGVARLADSYRNRFHSGPLGLAGKMGGNTHFQFLDAHTD